MDIVFLDQNKWIELAQVASGKIRSAPVRELYAQLSTAVKQGRVLFPLTISHILETSKRNEPNSRRWLAQTQSTLSRGFVYRSRAARLKIEMQVALQRLFKEGPTDLRPNWAIAPGFMQAFEPMDEIVATPENARRVERVNRYLDPRFQYIDFMMNQDDFRRRAAHVRLAKSNLDLLNRIEKRRALLTGDTVDLRCRAYRGLLFLEHQDSMIAVLHSLGRNIEQLRALGPDGVIRFLREVPTLDIEAEMAARLEAKTGKLQPHDLFDMLSFYTAIPYSSGLVAEKAFISLAKQARLDLRYQARLSRNLLDLMDVYK